MKSKLVELEFFAGDEAAMVEFGACLGRCLAPGATLFLQGDLGAGKTTLCRGILRGIGFSGHVKSPTYTLVEPYELPQVAVYHFDLYRLSDPSELEYIGGRDYFNKQSICLVEWPGRAEGLLPTPALELFIQPEGGGRRLRLIAHGFSGEAVIKQLINYL